MKDEDLEYVNSRFNEELCAGKHRTDIQIIVNYKGNSYLFSWEKCRWRYPRIIKTINYNEVNND